MSDARILTLQMLSEKRISADEAITLLHGMVQTTGRSHHEATAGAPAVHGVFEAVLPAPRLAPIIRDNIIDIFNPY